MNVPTFPTKRKRLELSIAMKKAVCTYKKNHPQASQEAIAAVIQKQFSLDCAPGRATIGDILREEEKWLNVDNERSFRLKSVKHPELDKALLLWNNDKVAHNAPTSDELLIEQAKSFGEKLGIKDMKYSHGWLDKWKNRNGIKVHKSKNNGATTNRKRNVQQKR
ncbi:tc5 transposase DNA-binding domain-containing protein [Ditylenchus destructor]|uniref:Tc5 transposase DNA-binding domain-containing protein n=1 Tax=Ditylenchus destructor TaxID=166010 RepID=A0AAD4N234_9BILA|nr:tc5 transposase DNA-binding domain-containing protein [Ditylenchus destructor]